MTNQQIWLLSMYQAGWTVAIAIVALVLIRAFKILRRVCLRRTTRDRVSDIEFDMINLKDDINSIDRYVKSKIAHGLYSKMNDFKVQIDALKSMIDEIKQQKGETSA